jgi:hypothetical protein
VRRPEQTAEELLVAFIGPERGVQAMEIVRLLRQPEALDSLDKTELLMEFEDVFAGGEGRGNDSGAR